MPANKKVPTFADDNSELITAVKSFAVHARE